MRAFPMILLAVIAYNTLAFGTGAAHMDINAMLGQALTLKLVSGDIWKITVADGFIAAALVLLFMEIVKATRTSSREILNHALSLLTFIGAMAEFLVLKGFGTSAFFFITAMCLFDVIAGYTISIIAARRDMSMIPHEDV